MFSSYDDAISFLYKKKGEKRGLENIKKLTKAFSNPEKEFLVVHVAGTNGKGTVSTYLAKILENSGYKVGVFNSPHINRFTERIRVNSREVEKEFVVKMLNKLLRFSDLNPTFFEINVIMAFCYFAYQNVDVAVIEAGVGGRLDSTNVVQPDITIITSISMDHETLLGDTLEKIAFEKAGIIKRGVPVIIGDIPDAPQKVILDIAKKNDSKVLMMKDFDVSIGEDKSFSVGKYRDLKISRPGDITRQNASLSVIASTFFDKVTRKSIESALLNNNILPGRYELRKVKDRSVLVDVCHNVSGVKAFVETVRDYFKDFNDVYVVVAILKNKKYNSMIFELLKLTKNVIVTKFAYERCLNPDKIDEKLKDKVKIEDDSKRAIDDLIKNSSKKDLICLVGSFYFCQEVYDHLHWK